MYLSGYKLWGVQAAKQFCDRRCVCLQLVPFIERVLYAEDDEGAAQAMEDCCQSFSEPSAESAGADNAITSLVGQMSPLRI